MPFLLQQAYRFDVLRSSLIFTPWPLAVVLVAPLAEKLTGRIGASLLASAGVSILAIGLAALALLPGSASIGDILWRLALCGVGYGLFLPPNNSERLGNVAKHRAATASGVLSTAKSLGQSLGAALVAVVMAMTVSDARGFSATGFARDAFGMACMAASISCAVSVVRIRRRAAH